VSQRILITSPYYWPEIVGSAPYVTGVAEHLSQRGHAVTVVTAFPHYPAWQRDRSPLRASGERGGVRIRRRWLYVPSKQSALRRACYEASLLGGGLTALGKRDRPDVVIGFNFTGGLLAAAASALYHRPYGLVFHDLMGRAASQSGVEGGAGVARAVERMEVAISRRATRVGIIAEGFRTYLERGGVDHGRIQRLRTWSRFSDPSEDVSTARARLGWRPGDFVALHAGNMGHKQGLDNVLEAARLATSTGLRVVLAGDGNDRARLEASARARSVPTVPFLPLPAPGEYESMLPAADALILNQRGAVNEMALPSKLTAYFAAERPVVAAVSEHSETAHEIEAAGAGIVVTPDDPASLKEALLRIRDRPLDAARLGSQGREYANTVLAEKRVLAEYEVFANRLASAFYTKRPRGAASLHR